jgi:hypothetical protein
MLFFVLIILGVGHAASPHTAVAEGLVDINRSLAQLGLHCTGRRAIDHELLVDTPSDPEALCAGRLAQEEVRRHHGAIRRLAERPLDEELSASPYAVSLRNLVIDLQDAAARGDALLARELEQALAVVTLPATLERVRVPRLRGDARPLAVAVDFPEGATLEQRAAAAELALALLEGRTRVRAPRRDVELPVLRLSLRYAALPDELPTGAVVLHAAQDDDELGLEEFREGFVAANRAAATGAWVSLPPAVLGPWSSVAIPGGNIHLSWRP